MITVGVLGAGQLGRMLALAGYPLGLRFRFLDPAPEVPVEELAERVIADFDDPESLDYFTAGLSVVTYEFENVPVEPARRLEKAVPVYPPPGALGGVPLLLEGFVPFDRELSQLAVRGRDGTTAFYPLVENHHEGGILRLSLAPAPDLTPALQQTANDYTRRVLEALDYVGVLAIEFFQKGGALLANEMA